MSVAAPGRIVVGVDGTTSSVTALDWAAGQAELTGAAVEAVMTWRWPTAGLAPFPSDFDPAADAEGVLESVVANVRTAHPGVDLRTSVVEGSPGIELVRLSEGADLLVLGSRGHGEIAGLLLGSVGQYCVTQARCPVLIVHPGQRETSLPAAVAAKAGRL